MGYASDKAKGKSQSVIEKPEVAAARSRQEKAVDGGERTVTPKPGKDRAFSNQLKVAVRGQLKNPLNNYDSVLLPTRAPEAFPAPSKKSPASTLGKGKPSPHV